MYECYVGGKKVGEDMRIVVIVYSVFKNVIYMYLYFSCVGLVVFYLRVRGLGLFLDFIYLFFGRKNFSYCFKKLLKKFWNLNLKLI